MSQNASKILPKTSQDPSKIHQLRPKMLPRPPKFTPRCPSRRQYGPSGAQLGAILAPTLCILRLTSPEILTRSRQRRQKKLQDPSRSRFSLILDPSGPRFPMILDTFWMYFKCCFEHCVLTLSSSFDRSGERFSFFLAPLPAHSLYLLYMFRKALLYVLRMFVRSFPQSAGPRIGAAPVDWRSLFNPAQHL